MNDLGKKPEYSFEISLSVLNHLGRNLYRNFITVLSEAISNSWDADAKNVWIRIDKNSSSFSILDDGQGMSADDFQNRFLKIGYSKRKEGNLHTPGKRPFIGAKGIGKLALLSCAQRVTILTKAKGDDIVGGTIDNSGLDAAITDDLTPSEYPLELPDESLAAHLEEVSSGTLIYFDGAKEIIRQSIPHIRKLLALSFRFSTIDKEFTIHINDEPISNSDLEDIISETEFVWIVNKYNDEYTAALSKLKADPRQITADLDVSGFFATVTKPRYLKITGTDERATVDLFVNGRLRERNVLRHIPTQRIVESYLYGQVHFNGMDVGGKDPFTSSREGVVEDDPHFQSLLALLKAKILPEIIDEWDKLRLERGEEGDDENPRRTRKQRKVQEAVSAAKEEYQPEGSTEAKDAVSKWLDDLTPDAEFNVSSYVDCFLSENVIRRYLIETKAELPKGAQDEASLWRSNEAKAREEANLNFDIRKDDSDLGYLGMDALAVAAEGKKTADSGKPSPLWDDAIGYKPVRNVVGHTGTLTDNAKKHLNLRFENIKGRIRKMFSDFK